MRLLKLGLDQCGSIIRDVILLISLLLPSHVRISRATDINAPAENLRPLFSDIKQWEQMERIHTCLP